MIVLVDKDTRSYSNCIPRVQEARIKIKHATQRHERYTLKKNRITEIKPTMSVIKHTLDGINGRSDIKE